MLFNESIHNWNKWGAIFQSKETFTPLVREIFHRGGLPPFSHLAEVKAFLLDRV